jgi:Putative Ig domain/Abnormal spindle-like microcephaly-assoc'd, ASPM-SPD-2-Hydin
MISRLKEELVGRMRLGVFAICGILTAAIPGFAITWTEVYPTGLTFNPQEQGTSSEPQTVSVYNIGTTNITVNSISSSSSAFVVSGKTSVTVLPGESANYTVTFEPSSGETYSATLTITTNGATKWTINLSGVGTSTTPKAALNTTSLTFASQPVGTSKTQPITITNTGTASFQVTGVTVTYPFSQTGFSGNATTIEKGKSLTLQVSFFPTLTGVTNGTILISYSNLPPAGVSLSGTGVAATSLAVSTFPALPAATEKAAYQATLTAAGGTAPYTWSLASGSSLPSGLSLSSAGLITGTLASSVKAGTYSFTATATDSKSSKASAALTLAVDAATGAACNNIIFDAADGGGPLVDLMDLGTGYYLGAEQGGLYADGSNVRPAAQDAAGVSLAKEIQPLDSSGNPSSTGKYVFISIGESIAQQPFIEFMSLANADPSKNPNLAIVNGATGGATAAELALPTSVFWDAIQNNYLPNAGVTAKQVVVAWVNSVNGGPSGTFPNDMTTLQADYETVAQNLLVQFPNIKLVYFSSINYTGYSNGVADLSNEPWSYEAGFAVKNAIQDQINGNANLNFSALNGPVMAPWMAWGPYYWANGMLPRSDGLVWTCQDLQSDGTHPSSPAGRIKVSTQLLNFLKSDDTASIWFLAH